MKWFISRVHAVAFVLNLVSGSVALESNIPYFILTTVNLVHCCLHPSSTWTRPFSSDQLHAGECIQPILEPVARPDPKVSATS
jgi:hypothetical protein